MRNPCSIISIYKSIIDNYISQFTHYEHGIVKTRLSEDQIKQIEMASKHKEKTGEDLSTEDSQLINAMLKLYLYKKRKKWV